MEQIKVWNKDADYEQDIQLSCSYVIMGIIML